MVILFTTALLLAACSDDASQNESNDKTDTGDVSASQPEKDDDTEESDQTDKKEDVSESVSESELEEPEAGDSDKTSSKEKESKGTNDQSESEEEGKALSKYTSEEIEYARVWLQLGENQDISELNIERIPAGEPLNPDDKTSANYPEDVIQLAGSRLVDGSVTYSSNGDGTINEYDVPLRWDGQYPAGEDFYKEIIEDTKQISIDPGDDEKVEELIKILNMD